MPATSRKKKKNKKNQTHNQVKCFILCNVELCALKMSATTITGGRFFVVFFFFQQNCNNQTSTNESWFMSGFKIRLLWKKLQKGKPSYNFTQTKGLSGSHHKFAQEWESGLHSMPWNASALCAVIMARNSLTRAFVSVKSELVLTERFFFCTESKQSVKIQQSSLVFWGYRSVILVERHPVRLQPINAHN